MITRGRCVLLAVSMVMVGAGCVADDPTIAPIADERLLRGRWIVLHADRSAPVCEASIESADDFIERTSEWLGVEPRAIDYYLYSTTPFSCSFSARGEETSSGAAACALRSRRAVMSRQWFHQHEVAHVIAQGWGTDAPALLEEGLATLLAYEHVHRAVPTVDRAARLEDYLDSWHFFAQPAAQRMALYDASAAFLRFVVDRFGVAALRRWYESVDNLSPPSDTRNQFARATGLSFEDALRQWRQEPATREDQKHPRLIECSRARSVTALADARFDGALACRGYGLNATPEQRDETIELSAAGWHSVELEANSGLTALLDSCVRASDPWTFRTSGDTTRGFVWLDPGRHQLSLSRERATERVRWAIAPVEMPADRCGLVPQLRLERSGALAPVSSDAAHWPVLSDALPGQRALALGVVGASSGVTYAQLVEAPPDATISLCTQTCRGFEACSELRAGQPLPFATSSLANTKIELRSTRPSGRVTVVFRS